MGRAAAPYLYDAGFATLAYDGRGGVDVTELVKEVRGRSRSCAGAATSTPGRLAIVGSSVGASTAVLALTGPDRRLLRAAVALSPPSAAVFDALIEQHRYHPHNVLFVSDQRERATVKPLARGAVSWRIAVSETVGHGVALLESETNRRAVLDWLERHLGKPGMALEYRRCDAAQPPASKLLDALLDEYDAVAGRALTGGPSATAADFSPPGGAFVVGFADGEPAFCGGTKSPSDLTPPQQAGSPVGEAEDEGAARRREIRRRRRRPPVRARPATASYSSRTIEELAHGGSSGIASANSSATPGSLKVPLEPVEHGAAVRLGLEQRDAVPDHLRHREYASRSRRARAASPTTARAGRSRTARCGVVAVLLHQRVERRCGGRGEGDGGAQPPAVGPVIASTAVEAPTLEPTIPSRPASTSRRRRRNATAPPTSLTNSPRRRRRGRRRRAWRSRRRGGRAERVPLAAPPTSPFTSTTPAPRRRPGGRRP